jgi:hypothetical protein
MAVFCITSSNPEFQKLLAESGQKPLVFEMMVSKWMTNNEVYDRYPTLEELGIFQSTPQIESEKIDIPFFQLDQSKLSAADKKLDDQLLTFLNEFGVTNIEINNFKKRFGIDALGATDVMQKLIYLSSKRNISTVPEEAAHMMVMLMGKNHPLIQEAFTNIESWSGYKSVEKQYMPIYKDKDKVKIEALGHLIRDAVINKYTSKNPVEKTLFQKIKNLINTFLKSIRNKFGIKKNDNIVYDKQAVVKIAEGILAGDVSLVTSQKSFNYTNVDYNKALDQDPLAKQIVNEYTENLPFKLAGSLAIAKQTNIERWKGEQIHDLDFKVSQKWLDENGQEAFDKLMDKPNIVKLREIKNESNNYITKSYLQASKGYRIETKRKINSSAPMFDINVYDQNGNLLPILESAKKVKTLDFFIGGNEEVDFENVASWQDIFQGKLSLSPLGQKELMFNRPKDQTDYINVTPVNLQESKNKNLYFQINPIKPGVQELFETDSNLANQVYEALGFNKNPEFFKGNILNIDDKIYNISEKISSKNLAKRYGFKISSNIPVYIVKENLGVRKGGYDTNQNIIILSENSDKETIEHELIHSVEYNLDKKELNFLYEKVKNKITEDSFKDYVSWNFKKSISEFIADSISKKVFRDALEKEGLLNEVDSALAIYKTDVTPQQKQQALQLYSQYLDTIFPNSQVKDIVYHGTKSNEIRTLFDKSTIQKTGVSLGKGFFFSRRKDYVERDAYGFKKIGSYLINTINPISGNPDKFLRENDFDRVPKNNKSEIKDDYLGDNGETIYTVDRNINFESDEERTTVLQQLGYDAVDFNKGEYSNEIVVFEPEQIHILGSKQDIEGFKEFVSGVEDKASESGLSLSTEEAAAYNSLVSNGTIPIKCE